MRKNTYRKQKITWNLSYSMLIVTLDLIGPNASVKKQGLTLWNKKYNWTICYL